MNHVKQFNEVAYGFLETMIDLLPDEPSIQNALTVLSTMKDNPDPAREEIPIKQFFKATKPFCEIIKTLHENPDWLHENSAVLPWVKHLNLQNYWELMPEYNKLVIAETIQELHGISYDKYTPKETRVTAAAAPKDFNGLMSTMQESYESLVKEKNIDEQNMTEDEMGDVLKKVGMDALKNFGGTKGIAGMFDPAALMGLVSGLQGLGQAPPARPPISRKTKRS